jgi:hypothetical protein
MEPAWVDEELLPPVGPCTRAHVLVGDCRREVRQELAEILALVRRESRHVHEADNVVAEPGRCNDGSTVRVPDKHHGPVDGGEHGLRVSRIAGRHAAKRVRRRSDVETVAGERGVPSAPARGVCERAVDKDDSWIGHIVCLLRFVVPSEMRPIL